MLRLTEEKCRHQDLTSIPEYICWNYSKSYLHEERTHKTSSHEERRTMFIYRNAKTHFLHKLFSRFEKNPLMSDLLNSVKWLSEAEADKISSLTSRLNWKFHYQFVCSGVESGCCLFRINFLWQRNIESVHSWNTQ